MSGATRRGYSDDLAYIHDVGHGGFARDSAPGLLEIIRGRGLDKSRVVDLGCGSGIWARELTDAGFRVHGVDISPGMIRIARKRAPAARFRVGSLFDGKIPPCNVVTSIGECLNYLFDGTNSRRRLRTLFGRVATALAPGGLFIFDLLQPGYLAGAGEESRCVHGDDWTICLTVREDAAHRRLVRDMTVFRKVGSLYRRRREVHCLRLYDGRGVAADLRSLGFTVRMVKGYGGLRFRRTHVGFIARRK